MHIDSASFSHPGGRPENQDAISELRLEGKDAICWVLADGLGGHHGGQIASSLVVESILRDFEAESSHHSEAPIAQWIEHAHAFLIEKQGASEDLSEMRSTVVALTIDGGNASWSHCGDSRIYWFDRGEIIVQSEDHSIPQALVKLGQILPEQIRFHEDRNRISQCLGSPNEIKCSINPCLEIRVGNAFILCSDGFWEFVYEPEMLIDLAKAISAQHWLDQMVDRCKARAPKGSDNFSAIAGIVTEDA